MLSSTRLHVPAAPVTHPTSGLAPFHRPRTLAPLTRLCRESCTVITTVAVHLFPLLVATPSRLPTCRFGGLTVIAIATASLLVLLSASFCVAIRMCPLVATPAVFHLMVRVALAPAASPAIV